MNDPNRIVGWGDDRGALRCTRCAEMAAAEGIPAKTYPVFIDSPPHGAEPCDICGLTLDPALKRREQARDARREPPR